MIRSAGRSLEGAKTRKTGARFGRGVATVAAALMLGLALAGCGPSKPFVQESPFPPAVDPAKATIYIETPTGIPGNTATGLMSSFKKYGKQEGINFVALRDTPPTYSLRCHFNAVGDTAAVTVISICDVVDGAGRRVHRITVQEPGGTTVGDPWTSVGTGVSDLIAQRTVVALRAWLYGGNV